MLAMLQKENNLFLLRSAREIGIGLYEIGGCIKKFNTVEQAIQYAEKKNIVIYNIKKFKKGENKK